MRAREGHGFSRANKPSTPVHGFSRCGFAFSSPIPLRRQVWIRALSLLRRFIPVKTKRTSVAEATARRRLRVARPRSCPSRAADDHQQQATRGKRILAGQHAFQKFQHAFVF